MKIDLRCKIPPDWVSHSLGLTLATLFVCSYSYAQTAAASQVSNNSFQVFTAIIGVLLSICGFLAVFILNSMWTTQRQIFEKLMTALTRIEVLEQGLRDTRKDLEDARDDLKDTNETMCRKEDCPYRYRETKAPC